MNVTSSQDISWETWLQTVTALQAETFNPINRDRARLDADHEGESSWVIGACMNVIGSVLINLGTNVMKLGHLRSLKRKRRVALADALLPRIEEEAGDDELTVYRCCQESWTWTPSRNRCRFRRALLSKTWVMGFVAFFIGNVLNFFSFGYAAQSLLASLGSVQFITNVIFARVVLKETLSTRVLFGTLVLIAGVALVVEYSCHGNPAVQYSLNELIRLFIHRAFLVYLGVLFIIWICCQCYLRKIRQYEVPTTGGDTTSRVNPDGAAASLSGKRGSKSEAIAYAAVSAIVGAQAVMFFKIVSELMAIIASVAPKDDVTKQAVYHSPFSYLVVFAAIFTSLFWIQRLNEALRLYDVLFIIPVFQVMWVTLSVVGGGIFFHEFEKCFQGFTAFMFVVGLLTIFFGVFLLSPQPSELPLEEIPSTTVDRGNRSPLLHRDSFFASGGGLVSLPTPTLVQAVSLRSAVSPFLDSDGSVSSLDNQDLERNNHNGPQQNTPTLTFGFASFPVVDAVEARDQRSGSGSGTSIEPTRAGSGRGA